MVGLNFLLYVLTILCVVGFLFAWLVRLASYSQENHQRNKLSNSSLDLTHEDPHDTHLIL
ncbi:MAG: hypothetical protein ACHQJ6_06515 [Candidatus Berkiellales bacterium]